MSQYEEDAEVAELKKWWQENWMALVGGLVLGLAGIFGWEAWQKAQIVKAENASHLYEDLRKSVPGKPDQAAAIGARLTQDFSGTPYATQGSLLLAQAAVARGDLAAAEQELNRVLKSDDESLRKVARLRLAQVLWQAGKPAEALAKLEVPDDDPFAPLYQELRGDILLSQGDRAAARTAYQKALDLGPAAPTRDLLQRKLNDLAEVAS